MGRRGEARAERHLGHGETRLLQQGMGLGQAQRSIMPRGTGGEAAGKQALQATRRKSQAPRQRSAGKRFLDRLLHEGKRTPQRRLGRSLRRSRRHGLLLRRGTMIDATLVAAQARPPSFEAGAGAKSPVDGDADWTRQNNKAYFGYKAHVAMDQGSNLIRRAILTPAKVYESLVADQLIQGDERAVYADRAYEHKERRRRLKALGIKDRIMHRSHSNQPALPFWQQRRNQLIIPIRAGVEHLFGVMKRSYGYRRVRYFSLARNALHLELICLAMNLRRAAVLCR